MTLHFLQKLRFYRNCDASSVGECNRVGDELCLPHANRVIQYYRNPFCRIKSWWVSRLHQEDNERNLQDIRTNYSQMSRHIFQTMLM